MGTNLRFQCRREEKSIEENSVISHGKKIRQTGNQRSALKMEASQLKLVMAKDAKVEKKGLLVKAKSRTLLREP